MTFFFDNCISPKVARAVNAIYEDDGHSAVPLRDIFPANTPDSEWINSLSQSSQDWVVITHDRRISKKPHERAALESTDLKIFFLDSGWSGFSPSQTTQKLLKYWDKIIEQAEDSEPGTSFLIQVRGGIRRSRRT